MYFPSLADRVKNRSRSCGSVLNKDSTGAASNISTLSLPETTCRKGRTRGMKILPKKTNCAKLKLQQASSRHRTFVNHEIACLEKAYLKNRYPKPSEVKELADQLKVPHIKVHYWFCRTRAKEKKGKLKTLSLQLTQSLNRENNHGSIGRESNETDSDLSASKSDYEFGSFNETKIAKADLESILGSDFKFDGCVICVTPFDGYDLMLREKNLLESALKVEVEEEKVESQNEDLVVIGFSGPKQFGPDNHENMENSAEPKGDYNRNCATTDDEEERSKIGFIANYLKEELRPSCLANIIAKVIQNRVMVDLIFELSKENTSSLPSHSTPPFSDKKILGYSVMRYHHTI